MGYIWGETISLSNQGGEMFRKLFGDACGADSNFFEVILIRKNLNIYKKQSILWWLHGEKTLMQFLSMLGLRKTIL